jgi:hypothetical protein
MVTGEVNGKNAFGAYAGYETFYFKDGSVLMASNMTLAASEAIVGECQGVDRAELNTIMSNILNEGASAR